MLEGLHWCGKALARDRRTRIADGVPSAAGLRAGETISRNAAASIASVAQHAQRGGYGSVAAFHMAFKAAAKAVVLTSFDSCAQNDRYMAVPVMVLC